MAAFSGTAMATVCTVLPVLGCSVFSAMMHKYSSLAHTECTELHRALDIHSRDVGGWAIWLAGSCVICAGDVDTIILFALYLSFLLLSRRVTSSPLGFFCFKLNPSQCRSTGRDRAVTLAAKALIAAARPLAGTSSAGSLAAKALIAAARASSKGSVGSCRRFKL